MTSAALPLAARAQWLAEARASFALAVPLAGAHLSQIALGTIDTLLMGWLSPEALAAGVLANLLYWIALIFGVGVTTAVAPLVAEARGGGRPLALRRSVVQGLWAAVLVALPAIALLWNTRALLLVLGQDPATAALAEAYMRPLLPGLLPALGFMALRGFVAGMGFARPIFAITLGALAVNAILAWGLMFGRLGMPSLGLPGAGIATSLVNLGMFLALAATIMATPALSRFRIFARVWRRDDRRLKEIFRVGLPIAGALVAEIGLFSAGGLLIGPFGTTTLAAHAIALQWASLAFMLPMGIAQAATIRVGLASGSQSREGIARAGAVAYALGIGASVTTAILFLAAPAFLIALFLDGRQANAAAVIGQGAGFLAIAALFQLVDGAQAIGHGVLRGLKDTRAPMLVSVVGYWAVGFVAAVLLAYPLGWGAVGVWVGEALGLATVAALLLLRFARRAWL